MTIMATTAGHRKADPARRMTFTPGCNRADEIVPKELTSDERAGPDKVARLGREIAPETDVRITPTTGVAES